MLAAVLVDNPEHLGFIEIWLGRASAGAFTALLAAFRGRRTLCTSDERRSKERERCQIQEKTWRVAAGGIRLTASECILLL